MHRHGHERLLPAQSGWDAHPALALRWVAVRIRARAAVAAGAQGRPVTANNARSSALDVHGKHGAEAGRQPTTKLWRRYSSLSPTTTRQTRTRTTASLCPPCSVQRALVRVRRRIDCGQFGDDFECCSRGDTVPGVCCSPFDLNQYDAPVPLAVIVVFLSCAGLLLLWIVFQDQFRSILSRVIGSASDFQTPQKRTRPTRWTSTP